MFSLKQITRVIIKFFELNKATEPIKKIETKKEEINDINNLSIKKEEINDECLDFTYEDYAAEYLIKNEEVNENIITKSENNNETISISHIKIENKLFSNNFITIKENHLDQLYSRKTVSKVIKKFFDEE